MMKNSLMVTVCLLATLCLLPAVSAAADGDAFARQFLAETNLARSNPRLYAGYLRELRQSYRGKLYRLPGSADLVETSEGVAALDEAIRFLQAQAPLSVLSWSSGLAAAAADLARDEGESGEVGHNGRASGAPRERIERHGRWLRRMAENIGYGPDTPRLMVMQLIVDDGVANRGHRRNIFTRSFSVAGAACGPHPRYRNMCVMDFADGFEEGGN